MIWLLILAQFSLPQPVSWKLSASDSPVGLISPDRRYTVRFALTVGPDGKVKGCQIETTSGNRGLDSHTCRVASRRLKFRAAKSVDGSASYGVVRRTFSWWVGNNVPPSAPPLAELYLTVPSLPQTMTAPISVELKFAVDATGRVSNCEAADTKSLFALAKTGCEELLRRFKPPPAVNADGVPVPSVQGAAVLFRKG